MDQVLVMNSVSPTWLDCHKVDTRAVVQVLVGHVFRAESGRGGSVP